MHVGGKLVPMHDPRCNPVLAQPMLPIQPPPDIREAERIWSNREWQIPNS